jgi:histidinol phosphatase-like PHP family hydrolase
MFGSDAHGPGQLVTPEFARRVCRAAGLSDGEVAAMFTEAERFARGRIPG